MKTGKKGALLGLGARILASLLVLLLPATGGTQQSMDVTTYYPSPSGNFEKLRVRNNAFLAIVGGNVAIGHEGPVAKLDVNGNALLRNNLNVNGVTFLASNLDVTGVAFLRNNLDVTGLAYLRNSLGIRTASPATPLDVNGRSYLRDVVVVGSHAARPGVSLDAGAGTIAANKLMINKSLTAGSVIWNIDVDPGQPNNFLRLYSNLGGGELINIDATNGRVWLKSSRPGAGMTVEGPGAGIHMVNGTRIDISQTGIINSFNGRIFIQDDTVKAAKFRSLSNRPAFVVNINSDDCGWGHPEPLGCPPGYFAAGAWFVGAGNGLCDAATRGIGAYNGIISKGWMALCVSNF